MREERDEGGEGWERERGKGSGEERGVGREERDEGGEG